MIDLGLAMLQRWWRPVYAAHALVLFPIAFILIAVGWGRIFPALGKVDWLHQIAPPAGAPPVVHVPARV